MSDSAAYWLETGFSLARRIVLASVESVARPLGRTPMIALLPTLTTGARLWGSVDPARAAGCAAGLAWAPLRALCRAAAMQFAPWPPAAVRGVLKCAEHDLYQPESGDPAAADPVNDAWLELAVAYARHEPLAVEPLQRRRLGLGEADVSYALWSARVSERAAALRLLPTADELPPGGPEQWAQQARLSLLPTQRVRACIALAAAEMSG